MRYGPVRRVFALLLRRWRTGQTRALGPSIVYLNPNTAASFRVRRSPLRLSCFSGALWITCDGDSRDFPIRRPALRRDGDESRTSARQQRSRLSPFSALAADSAVNTPSPDGYSG